LNVATEPCLAARRIQEIRVAKKMSRTELGEKLGLKYLQVYRYETGDTELPADLAAQFADALGVSVASLYRESRAAS
jgi:transcriptional regulator with XRE-family HTH domain